MSEWWDEAGMRSRSVCETRGNWYHCRWGRHLLRRLRDVPCLLINLARFHDRKQDCVNYISLLNHPKLKMSIKVPGVAPAGPNTIAEVSLIWVGFVSGSSSKMFGISWRGLGFRSASNARNPNFNATIKFRCEETAFLLQNHFG